MARAIDHGAPIEFFWNPINSRTSVRFHYANIRAARLGFGNSRRFLGRNNPIKNGNIFQRDLATRQRIDSGDPGDPASFYIFNECSLNADDKDNNAIILGKITIIMVIISNYYQRRLLSYLLEIKCWKFNHFNIFSNGRKKWREGSPLCHLKSKPPKIDHKKYPINFNSSSNRNIQKLTWLIELAWLIVDFSVAMATAAALRKHSILWNWQHFFFFNFQKMNFEIYCRLQLNIKLIIKFTI